MSRAYRQRCVLRNICKFPPTSLDRARNRDPTGRQWRHDFASITVIMVDLRYPSASVELAIAYWCQEIRKGCRLLGLRFDAELEEVVCEMSIAEVDES